MSDLQYYLCKVCQKSLPYNAYSKSQINKLEHKKIETVRCLSCTADCLPESEKIVKVKKTPDIEAEKKNQTKTQSSSKKFDPSMLYIKNPKGAPTVKDAISFAESHKLSYAVRLGPINGWRTVVKMAVRGVPKKDKKGKEFMQTTIGLFKPGSHDVASCSDSTAHHPMINKALAAINVAREKVGLNGYIEGTGHSRADDIDADADHATALKYKCYLKYVMLVLARQTNTVQLSLIWNTEPIGDEAGEEILKQFINQLSVNTGTSISMSTDPLAQQPHQHHLFHSIWVNYNPASRYNNAITGRGDDSWKLLFGERYIHEIVRTDMNNPPTLMFPPFVFRQANICAFTNIINNVRFWVRDMKKKMQSLKDSSRVENGSKKRKNSETIFPRDCGNNSNGIRCVELYAGVGTIGLNCLDLFSELNCSDENPHNLACFEAARAAIQPGTLRERATYRPQNATAVATSGGLRGFDLVLIDPPRKGMDDEVVQALLEYRTRKNSPSIGHIEKRHKNNNLPSSQEQQQQQQQQPDCGENTTIRNNQRLLYVSCGFPAFKRDCARLLGEAPMEQSNGTNSSNNICSSNCTDAEEVVEVRHWKLIHLEGHVLFPGSDHVETLAVFDRL